MGNMIHHSSFKPAWWLATAHAQTLYATLFRCVTPPIDKTERIELPDGDFIDLAWSVKGLAATAPLVILLHGLGGSVDSTYIAGLMRACKRQGWRAVLMHFRGASKEPNRQARAYHSGDTADFDFFLKLLQAREPDTRKMAIGISLGGNVLLKWLGEQGEQAYLDGAVAVSVPFELRTVANRVGQGFSRIYQRYLIHRLHRLFKKKVASLSEPPDVLKDVKQWRCFWTFDEKVTAPLNGFASVHHYYYQASCRRYLSQIMTPTLIIHAKDDPFMSRDALPRDDELSQAVRLELSDKGGHVGFISGRIPGKAVYWLEERIPEFFSALDLKLPH